MDEEDLFRGGLVGAASERGRTDLGSGEDENKGGSDDGRRPVRSAEKGSGRRFHSRGGGVPLQEVSCAAQRGSRERGLTFLASPSQRTLTTCFPLSPLSPKLPTCSCHATSHSLMHPRRCSNTVMTSSPSLLTTARRCPPHGAKERSVIPLPAGEAGRGRTKESREVALPLELLRGVPAKWVRVMDSG